jgi:FG-GAP repeat
VVATAIVVPWRLVVASIVLSLSLAVVALNGRTHEHLVVASMPRVGVAPAQGLSSLPAAALEPVSLALGADDPSYHFSRQGDGFLAQSPAQSLRARFGRAEVTVASGTARLGLTLRAAGYGSSLRAVGAVAPRVQSHRVVYAHAGLSEWYANGPAGIEQGFTIRRTPGDQSGPLTLSMTLTGNLHGSVDHGGDSLLLSHTGRPMIRYDGLEASDARGRTLRSWLVLHGTQMLLRVETRGARYPLRIDPLIQQAKLSASESAGASVALSADGNTALIGGSSDEEGTGAAWVFVRSGTTWIQQAKLMGFGEVSSGRFGDAVALSADGNTALIGAREDNGEQGAAWVFTRSGTTWTQQGEKLIGGGESGRDDQGEFGDSVALSADGNTALIGGASDGGYVGAAWVFTRSGTVWAQQGPKLTGSTSGGTGPKFGTSVALSAEGNTALIGGPYDDHGAGAAWVFMRTGSTWSQQGEKLTGTEELGEAWFGDEVALSADGNTAVIGGPFDSEWEGGVWVFTRSGSQWTQQGKKLVADGEVSYRDYAGLFGESIALSANGNTAVIAASSNDDGLGGVWTFTRTGSNWTQQGEELTGGIEEEAENGFRTSVSGFGDSLALSSEGDTALIAGFYGINGTGAAWVFVNPSPNVATGTASNVEQSSATLSGTVEPGPATTVHFQYGASETYGYTTTQQSVEAATSAAPLTADVTGLLPGTTYHFRMVSENSLGTVYGDDESLTTAAPVAPPPSTPTPITTSTTAVGTASKASTATTRTPATLAGPPNVSTVAPAIIVNVAQSNRIWRADTQLSKRSARRPTIPLGTTFYLTLDEQANISLTFEQLSSGRRVDGRCVVQTRKNSHAPLCHKPPAIEGAIGFAGHHGKNEVRFAGVIPYSKTLQTGSYMLVITATNSAGQHSKARELSFAVVS